MSQFDLNIGRLQDGFVKAGGGALAAEFHALFSAPAVLGSALAQCEGFGSRQSPLLLGVGFGVLIFPNCYFWGAIFLNFTTEGSV